MTRWLAMPIAALMLACAADAGAQTRQPKAQKAPAEQKSPLHLYLAKGEPNICGEGCSEWIAVEGRFDEGAAARAQAFLKQHGARKLPVYFHSNGGIGSAGYAIGRQLRQLGVTVGVGATVPRVCASMLDQSAACSAAKRSGQPVAADLRPNGLCNSACIWALIGGKVRHVPPSARLGVHSPKITPTRKQVSPQLYASLYKTSLAEAAATARRYIREMRIDTALLDAALEVPNEKVRYLNRDEIAAFGIDRREFAETPWFLTEFASGTRYVSKWIVEAKEPERKHYRVSVALVRCSGAHHVAIQYFSGLVSDDVGQPVTATFGKLKPILFFRGKAIKEDSIDTGTLFVSGMSHVPFEDVEAAALAESIDVLVVGYTSKDQRVAIKLSTRGLAEGLKILREICTQPVANRIDGGKAFGPPKNIWNPKGLHLPADWKPSKR